MTDSFFDQPAVAPPLTRKPVPALIRLEADDDFNGVILSDKVHWIGCHWDGKRSLPHLKEIETCEGCQRELPKSWKGFLFVIFNHDPRPAFLELSHLAGQNFNMKCKQTDTARGCKFRSKRERRTKKSPVCVTHIGDTNELRNLPRDQSPIRTMCRIWRCEHLLDAWLAEQEKV